MAPAQESEEGSWDFRRLYALCEVTGGGRKVYGIAVQYDAVIDPASLALDTYTTSVFPATRGGGLGVGMGGPGMGGPQSATPAGPKVRPVAAIYTNAEPALLGDRKSVAGMCVIAEFARARSVDERADDRRRQGLSDAGQECHDGEWHGLCRECSRVGQRGRARQ